MPDVQTLTVRIEQLETRIAHQDRTIEDLDKTVTEQWGQIDALTKQVERMAASLQQIEDNAPGAEPPPPHY